MHILHAVLIAQLYRLGRSLSGGGELDVVYTYERANEDALRLVARFLLQGRIGVGETAPAHKYERFVL